MPTTETNQYSEMVFKIHNEFKNAERKTLLELIGELRKLKDKSKIKKSVEKANLLRKFGFLQAKESDITSEILNKLLKEEATKQNLFKKIWHYRIKYPGYKFITEQEVEILCKKYNLACGPVIFYKGYIPDSNLKMIEKFKDIFNDEDAKKGYTISKNYNIENHGKDYIIRLYRNIERERYNYSSEYETGSLPMKICSPINDLDTKDLIVENDYILKSKPMPDPIVLQPVHEGYLIVTAWGNEATDELVINPINN